MNSEKVKEIKKALELNEYYAIEYFPKTGEPKVFRFNDILTIINELESENEKLKQHKQELQGGQQDLVKTIKAQCERIAELENGIAKSMLGCEFLPECTNDKLEQFTEMLKEKGKSTYDFFQCPTKENKIISFEDIDETLKEALCENI